MAIRDRLKVLAIAGLVLLEPGFIIYRATTPGNMGVYVPPAVALSLGALVLTGFLWWLLRKDGNTL